MGLGGLCFPSCVGPSTCRMGWFDHPARVSTCAGTPPARSFVREPPLCSFPALQQSHCSSRNLSRVDTARAAHTPTCMLSLPSWSDPWESCGSSRSSGQALQQVCVCLCLQSYYSSKDLITGKHKAAPLKGEEVGVVDQVGKRKGGKKNRVGSGALGCWNQCHTQPSSPSPLALSSVLVRLMNGPS